MGQKVYPTGFRLGITENWRSRWFADKDYAKTLGNDLEIRKFVAKRLARAAVSRVEIERAGDKVKVIIYTARPGIVIGKKGSEIDTLRGELERVAGVTKGQLSVDVIEIKRPELDANLVAQSIAEQLEGRVAFRRAMRKAVQSASKAGAKGIRIQCSGRLGGAEMGLRSSRRRRDGSSRVVPRGSRAAAHPARQDRLRHVRCAHHHGCLRREGLDLSGREAPRPARSQPCARGRASPPSP